MKSPKSSAPALTSGLRVLETIAAAEGRVGFKELAANLDVARATLARLIKVLKEMDYVGVDPGTGKYVLGEKGLFGSGGVRSLDSLRFATTPILTELARVAGGMTVLLFVKVGAATLVVNKAQPEGGEAMPDVGRSNPCFDRNPWGWLCHLHATPGECARLEAGMEDARRFRDRSLERTAFYERNGFMYDDREIHEHRRRLAAPVFRDDRLRAVVGLGANELDLPAKRVRETGKAMIAAAADVAELL